MGWGKPGAAHARPDSFDRSWLRGAALVLATGLVYLPAVSAGFIWDDQYYVTENLHLTSLEGLRKIWFVRGAVAQYYPMVHTTMWLEYRLFGLDPMGYHVVNIALQALNALLFWRLLERLKVPGAWLAAGVFALHPVGCETVAWVAERKNLLSLAFYLLAAHAYFRFEAPEEAPAAQGEPTGERDPLRWAVAFGLFALALLAKSVTFSLPAAIALVFWWKRGRLSARALWPLLPFVVAGALFGWQTATLEREVVGATGSDWELSPAQRLLIAGRASWFYLGKLVWPADLSFNYPRWEIDPSAPWQWLAPVAVVFVLALAWATRDRIGRGPLVAMLFFGGTLTPALGFFDLYPFFYSFVADHFQYHASLGAIALFAAVAVVATRRVPDWARAAGAAGLLAALGVATWQQAHVYQSPLTLWNDVLEQNPESRLAHNNLGVFYERGGNFPHAAHHARQVLALHPDDDIAHFNLANALLKMGKLRGAERHYRAQVERDPLHFQAYANLGTLFEKQGRSEEAEAARARANAIREKLLARAARKPQGPRQFAQRPEP